MFDRQTGDKRSLAETHSIAKQEHRAGLGRCHCAKRVFKVTGVAISDRYERQLQGARRGF
jgi:hypothetical protein